MNRSLLSFTTVLGLLLSSACSDVKDTTTDGTSTPTPTTTDTTSTTTTLTTTPPTTTTTTASTTTTTTSTTTTTTIDVGLWYLTCGDPVCNGYTGPFAGVPLCTAGGITLGDPCGAAVLSETCDPVDSCNALLECATSDPTLQPGGCPISLAKHKREIHYLSANEREKASQALHQMKLATWRYRGGLDDGADHFGFMIDDVPGSAAVRPDGGHVDLYGYTSLAVAAIQQQQLELDALKAEINSLKAACSE